MKLSGDVEIERTGHGRTGELMGDARVDAEDPISIAQLISQNQQLISQLITHNASGQHLRPVPPPENTADEIRQLKDELVVARVNYYHTHTELMRVRTDPKPATAPVEPGQPLVTKRFGSHGTRHTRRLRRLVTIGLVLAASSGLGLLTWAGFTRSTTAPNAAPQLAETSTTRATAVGLPATVGATGLAVAEQSSAAPVPPAEPVQAGSGSNGLSLLARDETVVHEIEVATAYQQIGKTQEALHEFRAAVAANPKHYGARFGLASLLEQTGQTAAAVREYRAVLQLTPEAWAAANNLACILATCPDPALRNGPEALRLAQHMCEATQQRSPEMLETLAAAYAETGHFAEATQTCQRAIELARQNHQPQLVAMIEGHLRLYQAGQPFRQLANGPKAAASQEAPDASM